MFPSSRVHGHLPLRLAFGCIVVMSLLGSPRHARALQQAQGVFLETLEDDNTWLPLGNIANEGQRGNTYGLNVWWDGNFGTSKFKLSVRLTLTSTWKGIAGNFGFNTNPDFRIEEGQNPAWDVDPGGQSATTKDPYAAKDKVKIVVSSFDFGGSTTVIGSSDNYYLGDSDPKDVPKDDDFDSLPNVYERMFLFTLNPLSADTDGNGIEDGVEDNDDLPKVTAGLPEPDLPAGAKTTLGVLGDGLVNWEEYRGFVAQRAHVRTNWKSKDFFVYGLTDLSYFGLVRTKHPATVRILQFDERSGDRLVNDNNLARAGVTPQRALLVQLATTAARGVYGQTYNDVPSSGASLPGISVGANGVCDTQSRGDDSQLIPFGAAAAPGTVCIDTGSNGQCDTTAGGDDVQLLGPDFVSLTPNETQRCDIYVNQIDAVSSNERGFNQGVNLTVAHECGHGTDMEHYPFTHNPKVPGHKHPSIMADSPIGVHPLPDDYDDVDYTQMRLHRKHP